MSSSQPRRGGFLRGFLVGTLISLGLAVALSVVFPPNGSVATGPSTPPVVVDEVPTAKAEAGQDSSGVETPTLPEQPVEQTAPEPAPQAPEQPAEPAAVTRADPAPLNSFENETPLVVAEAGNQATEQPDLTGYSSDVATPLGEESQPTARMETGLEATELNSMLDEPEISIEPMVSISPEDGAGMSVEPMIPLAAEIEPMVDITPEDAAALEPDPDLAVMAVEGEPSGADLAEAGIVPTEDAPSTEAPGDELAAADSAAEPAAEGAEPAADAAAGEAVAADDGEGDASGTGDAVPAETGPVGALKDFAAVYEDKGEKPLLAVVLVDAGEAGLELGKLQELGIPLTIGIPSDVPDAADRMANYRLAGFEVVALAPGAGVGAFRRGQNTADVAVQLEAIFSAVPQAVAVMDPPGGELPKDTQLVRAVLLALKLTGHALLTQAGGFNSVGELAEEAGVPSATVMRQIDKPDSVSFAMSRASLQAGKTGSAVIMADTTPDMVKAVVDWLLSPSARSVAIAPVSAAVAR